MPMTIGSNDRLKHLEKMIRGLAPIAVCFSGGMDSSFLLWVCARILSTEQLTAVTFCSPATPAREMKQAVDTAVLYKVRHIIYPGPEINNREFLNNDLLRCYYCKRERFNFLSTATNVATQYKILDGSVIDDLRDYRPGRKALDEAGIISPMLEAGISKRDIRTIASGHELHFINFVNESCLATRIKTGQPITTSILATIATGEDNMYRLGFKMVRARWNCGEVRLEFGPEELTRAFELRDQIKESFQHGSINTVSIDLRGYIPEGGPVDRE
jgi:pyridinium-3,5-biscarboxylic acid mononucleotide sulfurtransferase